MSGFSDANEAREVMTTVFQEIDLTSLPNLQIVYSYRFTDIDWSFTVSVQAGTAHFTEGILPESETIVETTSDVFHRVVTGQMNMISANLTDRARIVGSVGNVLELRAIFPAMSEAYRSVIARPTGVSGKTIDG